MNKRQKKIAVGVGVGVTALAAAAAAGTYFFAGKRGAKNRAKVSKWADSAKTDVVKRIKGMGKVTKASYNETVDTVMGQYKKLKKLQPTEVAALASELKGHWDTIAKEVSTAAQKVVPKVKKEIAVVKKTVKKAVKKSPPKKSPAKKARL